MIQKPTVKFDALKPLPLAIKRSPLMNPERNMANSRTTTTHLVFKGRILGSPERLSSLRR
ncbi:hypothetical protein Gorai_009502 [Gossypium raimondii]|uniref:Uncharacterized protein n=1 Tax=Gossypium raimondii TaxID=29730 RepID=A0A7J8PTA2_GOSRA|nr:hypothetical protein [Gossypium raimondii]